jgi:thiol:disulfide interchange protein DsbC
MLPITSLSARSLAAGLFLAIASIGSVHAEEAPLDAHGADVDAIRATLAAINPDAALVSIKTTEIPGLFEVIANGTVLYMSADGDYLLHGTLIDVQNRVNLTDIAASAVRRDILRQVPDSEKIIFRPAGEVRHTITVFTDVSCGYCQQLHQQIGEYLAAGIQVEYLAYPRGGAQSPVFGLMTNVWCAEDRNAALSAAIAQQPVTAAACQAPVTAHLDLGERLGVQGTPAIYDEHGENLGGYVPPAALASRLDAKAAALAAASADDTGSAAASGGR